MVKPNWGLPAAVVGVVALLAVTMMSVAYSGALAWENNRLKEETRLARESVRYFHGQVNKLEEKYETDIAAEQQKAFTQVWEAKNELEKCQKAVKVDAAR